MMTLPSRSLGLAVVSALFAFLPGFSGCTSADTALPAGSPTTTTGGGGATANGATTTATSGSTGAGGCNAPKAEGFPYEPACCGYKVATPDVMEAGFDDGKGSGKADHVHVGLAGPSDSTFVIQWRTPTTTTATQVLLGTDKAAVAQATSANDSVQLAQGHHVLYGSALDADTVTRVHEVHVCGLKPATSYAYKVGGPGGWSEVFTVTTAPPTGSNEPIRFAVLGDSRNDPGVFARIEEALLAHAIDLQVFTGDAVATGASQAQWNAWFEATSGSFQVQQLLATAPFMPVNGNHENLAINYPAQFAVPQSTEPGEKAQGEEYYSFDYGNAHFVALNDTPETGAIAGAQLEWLKKDLAAVDRSKTPWVFAMHHRSTYSCGGHGSDLELRAAWQPLFDQYKVDMVFSGHDHMYERSKPIRGLSGTEGKLAKAGPNDTPVSGSGTLYMVAGGAGAPLYDVKLTCNHTHVIEKTRNYAVIDLAGNKLKAKAFRLDGTVLDEFEFTK